MRMTSEDNDTLKGFAASSARKGAGTETRPFLSTLLICVDKNNAMARAINPFYVDRIAVKNTTHMV